MTKEHHISANPSSTHSEQIAKIVEQIRRKGVPNIRLAKQDAQIEADFYQLQTLLLVSEVDGDTQQKLLEVVLLLGKLETYMTFVPMLPSAIQKLQENQELTTAVFKVDPLRALYLLRFFPDQNKATSQLAQLLLTCLNSKADKNFFLSDAMDEVPANGELGLFFLRKLLKPALFHKAIQLIDQNVIHRKGIGSVCTMLMDRVFALREQCNSKAPHTDISKMVGSIIGELSLSWLMKQCKPEQILSYKDITLFLSDLLQEKYLPGRMWIEWEAASYVCQHALSRIFKMYFPSGVNSKIVFNFAKETLKSEGSSKKDQMLSGLLPMLLELISSDDKAVKKEAKKLVNTIFSGWYPAALQRWYEEYIFFNANGIKLLEGLEDERLHTVQRRAVIFDSLLDIAVYTERLEGLATYLKEYSLPDNQHLISTVKLLLQRLLAMENPTGMEALLSALAQKHPTALKHAIEDIYLCSEEKYAHASNKALQEIVSFAEKQKMDVHTPPHLLENMGLHYKHLGVWLFLHKEAPVESKAAMVQAAIRTALTAMVKKGNIAGFFEEFLFNQEYTGHLSTQEKRSLITEVAFFIKETTDPKQHPLYADWSKAVLAQTSQEAWNKHLDELLQAKKYAPLLEFFASYPQAQNWFKERLFRNDRAEEFVAFKKHISSSNSKQPMAIAYQLTLKGLEEIHLAGGDVETVIKLLPEIALPKEAYRYFQLKYTRIEGKPAEAAVVDAVKGAIAELDVAFLQKYLPEILPGDKARPCMVKARSGTSSPLQVLSFSAQLVNTLSDDKKALLRGLLKTALEHHQWHGFTKLLGWHETMESTPSLYKDFVMPAYLHAERTKDQALLLLCCALLPEEQRQNVVQREASLALFGSMSPVNNGFFIDTKTVVFAGKLLLDGHSLKKVSSIIESMTKIEHQGMKVSATDEKMIRMLLDPSAAQIVRWYDITNSFTKKTSPTHALPMDLTLRIQFNNPKELTAFIGAYKALQEKHKKAEEKGESKPSIEKSLEVFLATLHKGLEGKSLERQAA